MNIDVDTNRDGKVENEPQDKEEIFTNQFGAIVLVNSDDDRTPPPPPPPRVGQIDWQDEVIVSDEDERELAEIKISQVNIACVPVTATLTIEPSPDEAALIAMAAVPPKDRINVYYKSKDPAAVHPNKYVHVLGGSKGDSWDIPTQPHPTAPDIGGCGNNTITLYYEGRDYCSDLMLKLTVVKGGGVLVGTDQVRVMPAPLIVLSNVRKTYRVFVNDRPGEALRDRLFAKFPTLATEYSQNDVWIQDECEFGISSWPAKAGSYKVKDDGVDLPREGPVNNFLLEDLRGVVPDPAHLHGGWRDIVLTHDSPAWGGNIEVSPPLPGTEYKLGRLVTSTALAVESPQTYDFLRRQRIQARRVVAPPPAGHTYELVELGADWLDVGHIDEFMMFVKGAGSKGFRIAIADCQRARAILGTTSPADPLDVKNYATFFYGTPNAHEQASTTTAASGLNTLVDAALNFKTLVGAPTNYRYVRIYHDAGGGNSPGQIGRIDVAATLAAANPANTLVIDRCWRVDDSEDVRLGIRLGQPPDKGANWEVKPPAGVNYVLVENTKMWQWSGFSPFEFPAIITSKEVREDSDLWIKNIELGGTGGGALGPKSIQAKINAAETVLKDPNTGLGVVAADFIRVPGVFLADFSGTTITNRSAAAFVPGMVNLCPVDTGTEHRLIPPRPFGPRWPWPQAGDPNRDIFMYDARITQKLHETASEGRTCEDDDFVDNWDRYHRWFGETHCGTNYRRIPEPVEEDWWTSWKDAS